MNSYNYTFYKFGKDGNYGEKLGEGTVSADSKEDAGDRLQPIADTMPEPFALVVRDEIEDPKLR